MEVGLEIRLLGGFDVRVGGGPLPPLRSRREQWLLALLVLRHDRDTPRDALAAALWPDNDEARALFYLRKALSNLRQALGDEAARLLSPTPRTVRLDLSGAFADVAAFDAALTRASGAADPAPALQEAVALYRGPVLLDCPDEWAFVERNQREQAYLSALETLSTHLIADGEPKAAVHYLRLLVAADPYRETASAALMQALSDCGDRAAVTVVYQELRRRLRQDLNAAPSPETEALYRELGRRERPALPEPEAPPLPARETRRHLPVPLTELIGREGEIAEIIGWMPRRRLVTLIGPGGIGKTRLAIAVAEAALPRFEQGVWFVDLAALTDPALVPQATAKALGVAEEPGRPLTETLSDALASRPLLLVLDNCEHLRDACAALAHALLSAGPALGIIATSRQALTVTGEQVFPVPPLPAPPPEPSGEDAAGSESSPEKDPHFLMEYDAVRLFVDRAVRVSGGFRLTRRNASAVVAICRQLDGIPLAIEMAAARLRSLSAGEVQSRLADRFRLLAGASRGVLPRQQTLRAAVDWSWDLLTDAGRTLLCRLSVFAGGWTTEAAESVCGDGLDVLDTLASLVDQSLVVRDEGAEGAVRCGMLETIRQYGRDRLGEGGERDTIQRRHRDCFLSLAEESRTKFAGPERARWLSLLDAEHDNLRHALAFCRDEPAAGEEGLRLGAALWRFWIARGHLREGRDHLAALLAHPGAQARTKARADALNGAGAMAFVQGDYAAARALHDESLAIYRERGDREGASMALSNLGNVAATQSDYAAARALYEEALTVWRELGEKERIGTLLNNLGNVANEQGDYDAARALHEESLAISRELDDRRSVGISLNNLGILADERGDYAAARSLFAESLEIHRELGPPTSEANNLAGLANVAFHQGDYAAARALYAESLALRRRLGDRWGIAISLQGLGATAFSLGDPAAARAFYNESLTLQRDLGNRLGVAETLESLATLAQHRADGARAARLWGASSALRQAIGSVLPPPRRAEWERDQAAARAAMGEAAFDAARDEGRALTMEQAVEYALE